MSRSHDPDDLTVYCRDCDAPVCSRDDTPRDYRLAVEFHAWDHRLGRIPEADDDASSQQGGWR